MGNIIDPVVAQSPSDTMVIKPGQSVSEARSNSILCPITGGPHSDYTLSLATMIAKQKETSVAVLNVLDEDESPEQVERKIWAKLSPSEEPLVSEVKVVDANRQNVSGQIIKESRNHGLVMMGATRKRFFNQLLFGTVPRRVAAGCDCTVIMSKKYLGLRSWAQRWLGT